MKTLPKHLLLFGTPIIALLILPRLLPAFTRPDIMPREALLTTIRMAANRRLLGSPVMIVGSRTLSGTFTCSLSRDRDLPPYYVVSFSGTGAREVVASSEADAGTPVDVEPLAKILEAMIKPSHQSQSFPFAKRYEITALANGYEVVVDRRPGVAPLVHPFSKDFRSTR